MKQSSEQFMDVLLKENSTPASSFPDFNRFKELEEKMNERLEKMERKFEEASSQEVEHIEPEEIKAEDEEAAAAAAENKEGE